MKNPCHLATLLICLQTVLLKVPALAMEVTQPIKMIAERHNVTLKCMYNTTGDGEAKIFRVTVYRSKEEKNTEVCAVSFNNSMESFEKRDVLHCIGQPRRNSISVKLIGMNTSHSDWYFCRVEKMYPLPYTKATGNGTWIFIKPDVEVPVKKRCPQVTEATLIILALASLFLLYSVVVTYLHWPVGATVCIFGMKETVDMKCELIHNSYEPATATWTGQRWETGPRQDVEKQPRGTKQ